MTATTDTTPALIHSLSPLYFNTGLYNGLAVAPNPVTTLWPGANLAIYMPMRLPVSYAMVRAYVVNGGAVSGNFDIGIYNQDFTKVISSGSTAQAGVNATQYVTLSTTLAAGSYYLCLAFDNGTAQVFAAGGMPANTSRLMGILQQAAAFVLPNPIVPASPANAFWPLCGITRASSGW